MNIYKRLYEAVERSKTYVRTTNEDGEHCEFDAINADKLLAKLKKLEKESGPKSSCCGAPLKLDDDGNGWTSCSHCDEPPVSLPPLTQEEKNHYEAEARRLALQDVKTSIEVGMKVTKNIDKGYKEALKDVIGMIDQRL